MEPETHSDNEGDDEIQQQWAGVSGRVVLLDVSRGCAPIALESCLALVRHMMSNTPKQLVGIAMFGTLRNDDRGLENVVQLLELKEPTVEDVRTLKKLCADPASIEATWGATEKFNLGDAFWQATRMFSNTKKTMNLKIVTVLSHFAEPDPTFRRTILKKTSDLSSLGIEINLVNVSDAVIPNDSFFSEIYNVVNNTVDEEWIPPEPCSSVDEIMPLIWQTVHSKRASSLLKMQLGPDVIMGVGLYHLCKPQTMPKKVHLHRETNDEITSSVQTFRDGDSQQRPVLQAEICMYQNFGGKNVELTCNELTQLRKFGGSPSIKLLGFKPASVLNMSKCYLQPCSFLYPDESSVEGSSRLFRCLRDRCLAKGCVPICFIVPRWYSHPRLVALIPQEQIIRNGRKVVPDGFHVIYIPYAENVRELSIEPESELTELQLECMKKIVNKLKFEYTCDSFENPKLQTFYSALEALALDDDRPNPVEDTTRPDLEMQQHRIGTLADDFQNLFGPFGVSLKRKQNDDGSSAKRKPAESVKCPDIPMLAARVSSQEVNKYTVPQLKQILKWRNPPNLPGLTGLKKDNLVELVYSHCSGSL